ncbi:cytochrome P450 [Thioclava sp. JE_KL1]|uniref:cytochrome P450 n=1 Tax=Thioclava sp. JE_KL1 TaxID=2651187 RepID=UPI00128DDF81
MSDEYDTERQTPQTALPCVAQHCYSSVWCVRDKFNHSEGRQMHHSQTIPHLPGIDSTRAFLSEGYPFISRRCDELGSDAFRTRLMLRPVTFLRGPDAVRGFYRAGRMTRRGAMPPTVVPLLQGKGSVQSLDGAEHQVRKKMFLDLMAPVRLQQARQIFAEEWQAAAGSWRGREIDLSDAVDGIMTRTALRWCGIDPGQHDVASRSRELSTMFAEAGALGPAYLQARWLRARCERWARSLIAETREVDGPAGSTLGKLAFHTDLDGRRMNEDVAAKELLNILRPIVAVGRYVVFAAHALHVQRAAIHAMTEDDEHISRAIAEEVRRLYPFFPAIGGRVREAFDWHGARFEPGDWLVLDLYGTNHDPKTWDDAESFCPERHLGRDRQPEGLVPQGGGDYLQNHRCPGEWLTTELLTEAVMQLRKLDWTLPEQNLSLPENQFPPLPEGGLRVAVSPN